MSEERLKFVARLRSGESMSELCREFGISRKTGYKLKERYESHGCLALDDRSRRPIRLGNKCSVQVEFAVLDWKRRKPHWGARKLREMLVRDGAYAHRVPAVSTIHAILDRHGLVKPMGPRRQRACGTALSEPVHPNDLWCVDYKGQFQLGNGSWCYPLTVTDQASRYLLMCEALQSTNEDLAFTAFERLFSERGLPTGIRSDNGVPFASPNGLFHLSKLSVWWLRLGIWPERIKPGRPQQNGRHERMHLTLKRETTRPSRPNSLQQQEAFDQFIQEFNEQRPHEAIGMKRPADLYQGSPRAYKGLEELTYPLHDAKVFVGAGGMLAFRGNKIHVSRVFEGQTLGLKEVEEEAWLVSFMDFDLGYIDLETGSLQKLDNPFVSSKL